MDGTRSFNSDILAGIAEGIESVLTSGGGIEGGKFSDPSHHSIASILGGEINLRSMMDPLLDSGLFFPPDDNNSNKTEAEDERAS